MRRVAQALLDRGLSSERPVVILSGNSIEHALLALAAMYSGVIYTPIAPRVFCCRRENSELEQVFDRVGPGLVFAADGAAYERALSSVLRPGIELVVSSSSPAGLREHVV